MRIGILTSIGETIDSFFPPLIARWEELGHEVRTAASTPSGCSDHSIIRSVSRNPSLRNARATRDIAAWAEAEGIDVIVTNTATASFLARAGKMPVPVAYFCHGLHWNEPTGLSNRIWQGLELFALRRTDAVFVINDDDEQWFKDKFDPHRVHRLKSGVGVPIQEYPRTEIPPVVENVELVWAGEFSERKRPWLALEVIEKLLNEGVAVHLTMCGGGSLLEQTARRIIERGIEQSITLTGPSDRVAKFLDSSHGLLMTSAWEGLPRIGLEAIAIGRPVYAFDVKGTRSLPGVFLAAEKDSDQLAQIIQEHAIEDFQNQSLVDPRVLHPDRAAEEISRVVCGMVGEAGTR